MPEKSWEINVLARSEPGAYFPGDGDVPGPDCVGVSPEPPTCVIVSVVGFYLTFIFHMPCSGAGLMTSLPLGPVRQGPGHPGGNGDGWREKR